MNTDMIGYQALRRLIGLTGFFLPVILVLGKQIFAPGPWPGSVSDYYYTPMRDELVGALCAIGVFLSTYRGYDKDYIPIRLAAIFAIGVALCPTIPAHPSSFNNLIGVFHGIFAGLLFATLTYVCLFLFTRSNTAPSAMTFKKRQRNAVYSICGYTMLTALILIYPLTHIKVLLPYHPMFWLETSMVMAFGFSWLVKGQAILSDPKSQR